MAKYSNDTFLPEVGFIAESVVLAHVGVGRTVWRDLVKAGLAPTPQKWGSRLVRYDASRIRQWIKERSEANDEQQEAFRLAVSTMEAHRPSKT